MWTLYLLECKSGAHIVYYAGITTNLVRRFKQHQNGTGAHFTRANPPIRVLATREYPCRSSASVAESLLKKTPRQHKINFFD